MRRAAALANQLRAGRHQSDSEAMHRCAIGTRAEVTACIALTRRTPSGSA